MGGLSRRELLHDAAVAGAAATIAASPARALSIAGRPPGTNGRRVAILGGGMAGLAAAHELAERGFEVTVYERNALGGKARSIPVANTAAGGRRPLPGEHGFRFFPGFYHHVPDSMRRIPVAGNPNGVWDNLADTTESSSPRANGRADAQLFGAVPDPNEARTPEGMRRILVEEFVKQQGVPPHEAEFFANRVMVFLTSSEERRYGQWEHTTWWDFVRADGKSEEYRRIIARGLTRSLVAAKETVASTRTIGNMAEAFVMNIMQRGNDGQLDRVLNAPTNEAWIDPWVAHLKRLGVRFKVGQTIEALDVRRGRIESARARDRKGRRRTVEADWFVSAMPAERARKLLNRKLLALDPALEGMNSLFVDWMAGIQFYLRRPVDIGARPPHLPRLPVGPHRPHPGPVLDAQRLPARLRRRRGGGLPLRRHLRLGHAGDGLREAGARTAHATRSRARCGSRSRRTSRTTARTCCPTTSSTPGSWTPASPGTRARVATATTTPLLVNTVGSWEKRPRARTAVPNLFLAGDYVQTDIDLATMEGANESGRAAANALLAVAGSKAEPVKMFTLYDPPEYEPFRRADAELYRAGLPNALDRP